MLVPVLPGVPLFRSSVASRIMKTLMVIFVELLDKGLVYLTVRRTDTYHSYHFVGERSLKAEGCCHGYRAHTRVPLIRESERACVATKISRDIALSPKTHKDELSAVH
ncbi:uncharacterized protein LOC113003875 [Solenopsis invicta]|uniref:uncharacterized protein LOC113003875 n=1 Tax=Solenopsis invicta TaxID=13686 RepID=UPI00193D5731|nr:uncharacterized protein LOC113003875 [Solenopsis invicta]